MSTSSHRDDADSTEDDDDADSDDDKSTRQSFAPRWMTLHYATVNLRFEGLQTVPLNPEFVLELVHTATREVLELEQSCVVR